ncbi:MAG: microcin C transport system permease protein [Gammaproteobacteria bacterium]|jgi:microcin C transport system permease protein
MRDYFIRRFLLIIPTLFGILVIVFAITRLVPGGPLERAIMEMQQLDTATAASNQMAGQEQALSESQMLLLKEYYGFDKPIYESFYDWITKVLSGDLGDSYRYNEPVWDVIRDRFPISMYYGLVTLVITYLISIPLGVLKAIKHRTLVDTLTSILIFTGYAIPGYALGSLLLLFFSVQLDWFPMGGFVSLRFEDLNFFDKIVDVIHHSILPLICYLIGSFAMVTLLLKNHLLDNLSADYMRTAVSKGLSSRQAIFRHAMKNALIPIATTFGQNITLLVSGSFLIETIFDIDGFGLLGFNAILDRDYPVVMGVVLLGSGLMLIGNILSDFLVATIDPRVRFE